MLRPATDDDLAAMLTWRNQATNREVSIHSHVIAPEEHRAWWDRVQDDPSRSVLVFEVDGRALGVVTFFDVTADSAGWGFYLGAETLAGEVLERNEAVRLMNRRFGFKEGSPEQRTVDGQTITVIPITLLR